ncbi:MAG: ribosomal protein S18-alanine N-acetyltransferase [Xanthomonadales bacterium]|nr:ribosomal protein S18-alanine N-acetyltransferase [Xanthomonadales bacterium]MCB1636901.1 ribosomal protein S18-alanine N-acetyltransferase [Xanthomonadales bacterium]
MARRPVLPRVSNANSIWPCGLAPRQTDAPVLPRLRAAQVDDMTRVHALEVRAYPFPWTLGMLRDCLKAGYEMWLLEAEDGELIGYGILSAAGGEAHLLNLCIAPDRQGQGHGRRLLARLVDIARWHHAERMFLEVRPSNPRAIELYLRSDFSEVGRRPNYYPTEAGREDAIVMALELISDFPWADDD